MLRFPTLLTAALALCLFSRPAPAEDRAKAIEDADDWHHDVFRTGGYSWPGASTFNPQFYRGGVDFVLGEEEACRRIDKAFEAKGYKLVKGYVYDRDGVQVHLTGYDPEAKVGYLWATPWTTGIFGVKDETREADKPARLSREEENLLADRAPLTREFIAIVIPYTYKLGYQTVPYANEEERKEQEKKAVAGAETRLKALDGVMTEWFYWMDERNQCEYPSLDPAPRNLVTLARWAQFPVREGRQFECPVGNPIGMREEMVTKFLVKFAAASNIDLSKPYVYEKDGAKLTITGYDRSKQIGYVWASATPETEALARKAEADGVRIAWFSPGDRRFQRAWGSNEAGRTPEWEERHKKAYAIQDPAAREAAVAEVLGELEAISCKPVMEKIGRRFLEYVEWENAKAK